MNAKELMIGDLVYGLYPNGERYASPCCISAIDIYPTNRSPRIVTTGGYGFQEEDLAPIPLTPEILEKNGFIKTTTSWLLRDGYLGVSFQFIRGKWSLNIRNEFAKKDESGRADLVTFCRDWFDVIYVHELQHALRLCGIDKEIII